jgi:DNA-binding IclR family transcriptional regulator
MFHDSEERPVARTKPVQSVLRGIDLLDLLSEAPEGMRLSEMARALDLKAPTTHNLVRTLAMRGLVTQAEDGRYALGPGVLELADRVRRSRSRQEAEQAVRELGALECGPIVNYSLPATDRLMVRLRMSPDRPGIVQHPANKDNPIYSTANGLAFLAFAPEDQVITMRQAQPFHEYGIRLWPSLDALEAFLAEVRDKGCAVPPFDGQELYLVSAPVRDANEVAVAYLGAAVPRERMEERAAQRALEEAVREQASDLSARARKHAV